MKNTEQKIPALRFPEFSGEWEEKRLGEVSESFSGGTPSVGNKRFYGGEIPFIKSGEIRFSETADYITEEGLNNSSARLVNKGDILYALYGATSGEVGISKIDGAINQAVLCIRSSLNHYFLFSQLDHYKTQITHTFLQGGQGNLSGQIVKGLKVSFPSLPEQQKIADFLSVVDTRLQLLKDKKTKLEEYKRGVMQRIFSQELRFTRPDGSAYPDWEEKRLGEISEKKSSNLSQNELEFNSGSFKVYGASGFLKQIDFYLEENPYIGIVKDGAGVGRLFLCDKQSSVLGTLDVIVNKKNTDIVFLYYILNLINFEKYSIGSTIPHIYFKDYSKEKLHIPHLDEQRQIADFLSVIDDKISLLSKQIQSTEQYKKGLLQQMFV